MIYRAQIAAVKDVTPTRIDKFLGLNISDTGDTQIQLGESGNMNNFYITNDLKLRKIYGYKSFWDFESPVKATYPANLGGNEYLLVAVDNKLYYFLQSELDDDWDTINGEAPSTAVEIGKKYTQISTINLEHGEIRTYARFVSQKNYTTEYQLKASFYTEEESVDLSDVSLSLNGEIKTIDNITTSTGETTLIEISKTIERTYYNTIPLQNIVTTWSDSSEEGLSTNANIWLPVYGVNPTLIGTIGTSTDVSFFTFDKKVYILSGKYHSWGLERNQQTNEEELVLEEVEGYTPLVFINTPPSGGGLIYDEINMLSPKKHQTFNGDGSSTVYHLAQNYSTSDVDLTSIDKVTVNGVVKTVTTDYTVDLHSGTVTFNTAPPQGTDNVDIYWTLDDGNRSIIEGMKFGTVFGGDVDTRVFLYGNHHCPNRTYFSGLANGEPSVEYFPATAHVDIGPSNFDLTDLTRQYDRLLATTNRPEAYYLTISTEQLDVVLSDNSKVTRYVPAVSTFPLNEIHGNMAPGQGQLIENYPVTIDKTSLTLWKATNVRDEKNMEDISQRINYDLNDMNMKSMLTLDYESENQLWFGYDNRIYIYNYYNKTFSRIKITDSFTCYANLGNYVYMGLEDGRIVKWSEDFTNYDGQAITAHWEMNFSDFGAAYLRKTMTRLWVLMQPQGKSSAEIGYITNRKESSVKKRIEYKIQVLDDIDFSDFNFQISSNPQPFRLKLKAKKFTNMKITIDNEEETDCTILQLALRVESFGESK